MKYAVYKVVDGVNFWLVNYSKNEWVKQTKAIAARLTYRNAMSYAASFRAQNPNTNYYVIPITK